MEALLVLADGGTHIADIYTYWDDESGWETSAVMYAVEWVERMVGGDKEDYDDEIAIRERGEWRPSMEGGYYRIGDEIDISSILEDDDEEDEDDYDDEDEDDDE